MKAANTSRRRFGQTRLLLLGPERFEHSRIHDLTEEFRPGDLLVINRSATLPSSFRGEVRGQPLEIRLAAFQGRDPADLRDWMAVSFGEGDWRQTTETRGPPPALHAGDLIRFGPQLSATVTGVVRDRLLRLRFRTEGELTVELYRHGKPIQYSYLRGELAPWDQQTIFAGPPISVEPPSAGFAFDWDLVLRLRAKGVEVAPILHGAGLSSTGSPELDAALPLAEYFEVPEATLRAIRGARVRGGRIVALGTTVLRALESALQSGRPSGLTGLKISPAHRIASVTHLITGLHDLGASHMGIVRSLCPEDRVSQAYAEAERMGYLNHEYGDLSLVGPRRT